MTDLFLDLFDNLAVAMLVILVFGIYGVVTNDPSPHPPAMVWAGSLYLSLYILIHAALFAWAIVKH